MKALQYIKASDNISFRYNYEALNACFGADMKATLQKATWNANDGCKVWFPHIAIYENGRYVAGSKEVNWKNYFEQDSNVIIQMLYPGEPVNKDEKDPTLAEGSAIVPLHTFMKMGDKDYRYVGTYLLDHNNSTPRYQVTRRIKDGIDLSIWASGHDTKYHNFDEIGYDVYKDFYIDRSYSKQKSYKEEFLKKEPDLLLEEKKYQEVKSAFISKYNPSILVRMSETTYENEYVPELIEIISSIFGVKKTPEEIIGVAQSVQEFGSELMALFHSDENSINDRIRNSKFGHILAAQLFTIYDDKGYGYLYSLEEKDVDKMLYAIGRKCPDNTDLVNKQSELYFWRHCDHTIIDWSIFRYYQFLCFMSSVKKKTIQYVAAPKPDVKLRIVNEAKKLDAEISLADVNDAPESFEYHSIPRAAEIRAGAKVPKDSSIVPRHQDRKINALVRAGYCCEIDKNHPTFKRRNSDKNYTETHHLIPLEYSAEFQYTLDTEENIVSLCSNCHNQIHYGDGAEQLIKTLYEERREALKAAGIDETIKGVKVDYTQLLHMYGLD